MPTTARRHSPQGTRQGTQVGFPPLLLLWLLSGFVAPFWGGLSAAQPPADKGMVNFLGKEFPDLPLLWDKEPYAPLGEWLRGLGVGWTEQPNGISFQCPNGQEISWMAETTELSLRGETAQVAALMRREGQWWVPLVSLGRMLGLQVLVNPEKRQVRFLTRLQSVQLRLTEVGWLLQVAASYPLLFPPRVGTLAQPDRAYADFVGACWDLAADALPSGMDILTGVRIGQFSSDPPIARLVVDSRAPLRAYLLNRQPMGEGERWALLLQPLRDPKPWLGQITLEENAPEKAVVRLQGCFRAAPSLSHQGTQLVVEVPASPLALGENERPRFPDISLGGLVQGMAIVPGPKVTRLVLSLRTSSRGQLHPQGDDAWLLVIEPLPGLARRRLVVVDAGHGGHDPGASSPFSPTVEKHLTLDIALRLRRLLEQAGYRVQMTRETDVYIPLAERVAIANDLGADVFVSVHLNSFPRAGGQWGTEVYYWTPQSLPLAQAVYRNLLALLGRKGNGVRQRRLYVVHHTTMPSVLVEACYLNHPDEERLLRDEAFRERIALAIFQGIAEFFGDRRLLQKGLGDDLPH